MALKVGEKVSGKVSGITNFGAFVDLGDHKTGLVHISEVSEGFVKDIHDVLKVGDTVTVKVLKIGDDGKIALSIKQANESDQKSDHEHHSHHNNHNGYNKFNNHNDHNNHGGNNGHGGQHHSHHKENFDDMMSDFLKQSENRLATLKKNTEGKRGGRGGRRS